MAPRPKIRLAVLSFWHVHGSEYADLATRHPGTELAAIWDEDPERGSAEAEQRGVPFVPHLEEVLARDDVDGVIVTTPTSLHRAVILAAAAAGKHVFTEKVIAATRREAEEIAAAAAAADVAFMVCLRRTVHASTLSIKQLVDAGALGEVTYARVRDSHSGALPTERHPRGWLPEHFYDVDEAQGGALIDLGAHPTYLVRTFLGMPESVSAALTDVTGHGPDDNAVVTWRYPNGGVAVVETGFVSRFAPFSIELHGTEGSVLFHEIGVGERVDARLAAGAAGPSQPPPAAVKAPPDPFGPNGRLLVRSTRLDGARDRWLVQAPQVPDEPHPFARWVEHVERGTRAPENVALGVDMSALMEAAHRSAATGRTVRMDEIERFTPSRG
jgi:1,5-anhydro-D-fructose reductase (1,5-anhydro-D-mannitol-forming)